MLLRLGMLFLIALLPGVVAIAIFVATLRLDPHRARTPRRPARVLPGLLLAFALATSAGVADARDLQLTEVDREVPLSPPEKSELELFTQAVAANPKDRGARFALVRALMRARQFDAALREVNAWRAIDAYNLVVVRLLGDIYAEMGDKAEGPAHLLGGGRTSARRRTGAAGSCRRFEAERTLGGGP